MNNLDDFKVHLQSPRKMVLIPHFKPDADALGSALGLALYLRKKGHEVTVLSPSDYPDFLNWMPGQDQVMVYHRDRPARAENIVKNADTIFCIDFSSLSRLEGLGDVVKGAAAKKVLIDHHLQPEAFADFAYWDQSAASTGELV